MESIIYTILISYIKLPRSFTKEHCKELTFLLSLYLSSEISTVIKNCVIIVHKGPGSFLMMK